MFHNSFLFSRVRHFLLSFLIIHPLSPGRPHFDVLRIVKTCKFPCKGRSRSTSTAVFRATNTSLRAYPLSLLLYPFLRDHASRATITVFLQSTLMSYPFSHPGHEKILRLATVLYIHN